MNKHGWFLALTLACALGVWVVVLQHRLAGTEQQRLELEGRCQQLAAQEQQAREDADRLARELSLERTEAAEPVDGRKPAKAGNTSETRAVPDGPRGVRPPADAPSAFAAGWSLRPELADAISQRFGPVQLTELQPSIEKGRQVYL